MSALGLERKGRMGGILAPSRGDHLPVGGSGAGGPGPGEGLRVLDLTNPVVRDAIGVTGRSVEVRTTGMAGTTPKKLPHQL